MSQLTGKDPDDGKVGRQKEKVAEDETVRQHHWFNGDEFEQTPGGSVGQGSLCVLQSTGLQRVRYSLVTEQQKILTTTSKYKPYYKFLLHL